VFEDVLLAKEKVGSFVHRRLEEFENLGKFGETYFNFKPFLDAEYKADLFSELCFCLLTANSSASLGIKAQMQIGTEGFKSLSFEELTEILSSLGHRFARQRAERIVKARESFHRTLELLENGLSPQELRDLLSDTCSKYKVEGFGLQGCGDNRQTHIQVFEREKAHSRLQNHDQENIHPVRESPQGSGTKTWHELGRT
jgi:N-glycosylase/DNA lyase